MSLRDFFRREFHESVPLAPRALAAAQPGVWLTPGEHVIDGERVLVAVDSERDLTWHPLPRFGRYTLDGRIFYIHDPRRGFRVEVPRNE